MTKPDQEQYKQQAATENAGSPAATDPASPVEKPASAGSTESPQAPARVEIPAILPVLPIRGTVMFPGTVMPLGVGRMSSRRLLDESLSTSKVIALVTQRDEKNEEPDADGLYTVGAAVMVLKLIRQPDETVSIIVHGLKRIRLRRVVQDKPFLRAEVELIEETQGSGADFDAGLKTLREQAKQLIEITPNVPEQAQVVLESIDEPGNLSDFLAANLNLSVQQKQDLLEEPDVPKRVRSVQLHVSNQLEIARLQQKIQTDVQASISDSQRRFFLREQIKAIQKELGEDGEGNSEVITNLRKKIEASQPPEKVMTEAKRDLGRLETIPQASPEYSLLLTYLELVAELPWNKRSEDHNDLKRAREVLDRDHLGLDKVKRRLIEFLAVRKLNPLGRAPILCLAGPPGVGKTSLGQSIADALGRQFVRLALGGIRDEAEIRGHRRTYIGAMPGRLIQELRRAGTNNPVMMLDELDKLGSDFRGDPASALLEVLDPRQNNAFVDRYLDVPFDLSQVIFIATANYMGSVPPALRDRMEVIEVPGYTDNDKAQIATRYLVPRQLKENGLTTKQVSFSSAAIRSVIDDYTREAGVRDLERQIGAVCRGVASEVAAEAEPEKATLRKVDPALVRTLLGAPRFEREVDSRQRVPGVVVGLAYTPVGGEILFIEASTFPGKGNVILTGQIGDVMKESAQAAMSLFKSRAARFGLDVRDMMERDIHIHVPAGAVPKDGPSAGVAMFTAIASLLLDIPVKARLAMTGEITLRGLVLPIGGVKEKTLAAARAGIETVLLPARNEKDMEEVDPAVRKKLTFHFVRDADQLLELTLGKQAIAQAVKAINKRHASKDTKPSSKSR
jgi:ATP-dependent Lon protease